MPLGQPDVRVAIYKPDLSSILTFDATLQGDFGAGLVTYEDTPTGCGAATLQLGLRYEEIVARGYYAAMNIVEISTGDNSVATSFSAAATKVYVDSNAGFDTSKCPDTPLAYFWDGATFTPRVPVTGVGSDGGGPYITIGAPLGGGSIPAYAAGTIVGRRRYCGRIIRVQRPNQRQPKATVTCVPLSQAFDKTVGSFTFTSFDVGQAIYQGLLNFSAAGRWPFLTVSGGNFPTIGALCSGSNNRTTVSRFIQNALTGILNGDVWVLRVGHDRTPRLVKLYTSSGNTYTYPITLRQGVTAFEPQNVIIDAEDGTNLFNSVEVNGDIDPTTKQPFRAIVQDPTSIALYGQIIDAQPVTNSQCKSTLACAQYGATRLAQSSIATSNNTFRVYTRNDDNAPVNQPAGLAQGDVVTGVSAILVNRFDSTGTVRNMLGDSNFEALSWFWVLATAVAQLPNYPSATLNAIKMTGTGSAFAGGTRADQIIGIDVAAGQKLIISCTVDATQVTSGSPQVQLRSSVGGTVLASVSATAGSSATRLSFAYTVATSGILYLCFDANGCTVTNAATLLFYQPQVEIGSGSPSAYVVNNAAPNIFGLVSSAQTTVDTHGDRWQDVKFQAIQPDLNAAMAQRANALATALVANTAIAPSLDQYFVSPSAWPPASTSGLTVNVAAFQAVFGPGTQPVNIAASSFTLPANQISWVWIAPNGTWSIQASPDGTLGHISSGAWQPVTVGNVAGSILYGMFQTNGTNVIGENRMCAIGTLGMPVAYLINGETLVPIVTNAVLTPAAAGPYAAQLNISFDITNQPTDGSLSKIEVYVRQSAGAQWVELFSSVPNDANGNQLGYGAVSATGAYSFQYPQALNGQRYEFGVAMESGASKESAITSIIAYETGSGQNLIPDSEFTHASYQSAVPVTGIFYQGAASAETYWTPTPALDLTGWFLLKLGSFKNVLVLMASEATGEHDFDDTQIINVTPAEIYTLSCIMGQYGSFATGPDSTTTTSRFDPVYWTTDFNSTCYGAAVTTGSTSVQLTVEMNSTADLIGLEWRSQDPYGHPLDKYIENDDYSGITWSFNYATSSNLPAMSSVSNAPTITVTYNHLGPGVKSGFMSFGGIGIAGQKLSFTLVNGTTSVTTSTYTFVGGESASAIAAEAVTLINSSAAGTGGGAFLSATQNGTSVDLNSLSSSGTTVMTFRVNLVGSGAYASPSPGPSGNGQSDGTTEMLAVAYLYLPNFVQTGWTDHNANIVINFDTAHTGVSSSDPAWATLDAHHIYKLAFGATPSNYSPTSPTPLVGGTQTGTMTISSIAVTLNSGGNAANLTITVGSDPSPTNLGVGVAMDYSSNYPMTPKRVYKIFSGLGLTKHVDMYVSPSKYYSLHWNSTRGQYEVDSSKTINAAVSAWFTDMLARLNTNGVPCTVSVSFEILTTDIPEYWDQQDWNNNSAQTGYSNSTTLLRFMRSDARAWLITIFTAFTALIPSGADVTIEVGEPAWWAGTDNGPSHQTIGPCIFDNDTRNAYHTATGNYAVEIDSPLVSSANEYANLNSNQKAYVDYCLGQLGTFTDAISAAVKSARPGTKVSVLWYADAILIAADPGDPVALLMQYLNLPIAHWKHSTGNYDVMEIENYGDVVPTFYPDRLAATYTMASGAEGSGYLGYSNANIRYYSGFATDPDATTNIPGNFTPMLQAIKYAENLGIGTILIWADQQIRQMGYMFGSLDIVLMSPDGSTEYVTAYQLPQTSGTAYVTWTCPAGVSQVKARLRSRFTSAANITSGGASVVSWSSPMLEVGTLLTQYRPGPDPSPQSSGPTVTGGNLIPDSGWLLCPYASPGGGNPNRASTNPLWTTNFVDNISSYWEQTTAPGGNNSFQADNASHDYYIVSSDIPVIVGTVYTLSCYFDMTNFSGGPARAQIVDTTGATVYATLNAIPGSNGRLNMQWTATVTDVKIKLDANSSSRVGGGGANLVFAIPQFEVGASMSAYQNGPSTTSAGGVMLTTLSVSTSAQVPSGTKIGGVTYYVGAGAPSFAATKGDDYVNTTGSSGSLRYVNTGGSSWTAYA